MLSAVADCLIPPGDGFPAPSTVDVAGFVARFVAPVGQDATWYPFLTLGETVRWLEELGSDFLEADPDKQARLLQAREAEDSEFFGRVRDTVYVGYYSRPEVVLSINRTLPAGRDYRATPQPFGYSDTIVDWDEDLLARVRGTFIPTADIVPLSIPEEIRGLGPAHTSAGATDGDAAPRREAGASTT